MPFNKKGLAVAGMLLCVLLSGAYHTLSAATLFGRVTDTTGQPLPFAVVRIPDLRQAAFADTNGFYELRNLPEGIFLVSVHMTGYQAQSRQVNLQQRTEANFQMALAVLEQQEIVVTGLSLSTLRNRNPAPLQSISMQQLQEQAGTNIVDALTTLPGVQQISTGPAISKPVIRGLSHNRVLTLTDGVRQEGQQWGDEHGIEVDDYNLGRVEVVKGPASLAYGSDALAGVINIISEPPVPTGTVLGEAVANYQTNSGQAALHLQLAGHQKALYWQVFGTGKQAHDYQNAADGFVHNTRFSGGNYGFVAGLNREQFSSRLSFSSFNQWLGIATGTRDTATGSFLQPVLVNGDEAWQPVGPGEGRSYRKSLPYQKINHLKLAWENTLFLKNSRRLSLTLAAQQNHRREYEELHEPDVPALDLQLRSFTWQLSYQMPFSKGWHLALGASGMQQGNLNQGEEFLIPDYHLLDGGVYAVLRKEWSDWLLSGGFRMDARRLSADALWLDEEGHRTAPGQPGGEVLFNHFRSSWLAPSGSIGLSYQAGRHTTLKLNVATGYRAPNIAELSANGVHEGAIRYEYGHPGLKAERSVQADLGLHFQSEHLLLDAAVFYNHISNFIFLRKLRNGAGLDSIPETHNGNSYPAFVYDATNARLMGGELYADFHPHPLDWLHLEAAFSYVNGQHLQGRDSMQYLPYMPPTRLTLALRASKKTLGPWLQNLYFRLAADRYFAKENVFSAYGTEDASPGYTLFGASLGADVHNRKGHKLFSLGIAAENLTDKIYQYHLSRLRFADENTVTGRRGIFGMGRNISVFLKVPFQF